MEIQSPVEASHKPKASKNILKTTGLVVSAALIFMTGFGLGSGRIIIFKDQLYRKTVQKDLPTTVDYTSVDEVYTKLKSDFDGELDNTKLLDGLKAGLAAASGDPYTDYMNKEEAKDFNDQLNGTFVGIGAELSKDDKGNLIVMSPIAGYPAEKAGLKPKDIIVEINGESTSGKSINDNITKIRGEKGTKVTLKVVRNNEQALSFDIIREQITIASVTTKTLDGNIGYIRISRFAEDTTSLVQKAATDFKAAGAKGVILDMRNDPGGLLDAAVNVSSLWLPKGKTILSERRGGAVIRTYNSTGSSTLVGVPTVVLINDGSASASEITAGALHDNGVAKLIGVKSFGKGSVQQLEKLTDGGVLKVTIAHWYTPNGININKEGIKPDTEVKLSDEDAKAQRDPQLDAAQAALK